MVFATSTFGVQKNNMRKHNFYQGDYPQYGENRQKNRFVFGIAIAILGTVMLLKTMGLIPHFSFWQIWPVVLIVVGILSGIKHNFRNNAWWILILIGGANLTPQFMIFGRPSTDYVWPAAVIITGLAIALRPRNNKFQPSCSPKHKLHTIINTEGTLNVDVTFGGRKEVVTSKEFKGGNISVVFGGCELNLTQADFPEPLVAIDFRVSFGGVELVVPPHWEIQNDINPSFGSVEDERMIQANPNTENKKILKLTGNCSFGSIEIKSF